MEELGTATADILQAQRQHWKDDNKQGRLFKVQHQDSTRREGKWYGGNLCAAVLYRKSQSPPQVRHHYPQDCQGPGFIHRTPKVSDDAETGSRRIPVSVLIEGSREGGGNKCKLWVGNEGPHLPHFPSKIAPAPEEVPQVGAVKTPRHQDPRLHLLHQRYYQVPQQVPSLWGGTTPTRRQDPRAGRVLTIKGVAKGTHRPVVWLRNPRPHGARRVLWALQNCQVNIPYAGWRKSPKKNKQSAERHQSAKSAQIKRSYQSSNPLEEDSNKEKPKKKNSPVSPSEWDW